MGGMQFSPSFNAPPPPGNFVKSSPPPSPSLLHNNEQPQLAQYFISIYCMFSIKFLIHSMMVIGSQHRLGNLNFKCNFWLSYLTWDLISKGNVWCPELFLCKINLSRRHCWTFFFWSNMHFEKCSQSMSPVPFNVTYCTTIFCSASLDSHSTFLSRSTLLHDN